MSEPVEKVIDVAADVAAEISEQAEGAEKFIRSLNQIKAAYASFGVAIGGVMGAVIAYKVAYRKAEAKYAEISAEEIAGMRQHYLDKAIAQDQREQKGELSDLIRDRGYASEEGDTQPPMAITPPEAVVDRSREALGEDLEKALGEHAAEREDETRRSSEEVRNVFADNPPPEDHWDYQEERRKRSPVKPYIIHVDERNEQQAYDGETFTYYEEDDVLCNERDEVIAGEDRDRIVGEAHLEKFGHGSNDANIVYVRNDKLEMDVEIVRSPNSYAEEVHGFDPQEPELRHSQRRGKHSIDDE